MCMKASNSKGDARTVGYEGGKIHCLWRALEQGLFPFMMNEGGLTRPRPFTDPKTITILNVQGVPAG